MANTDIYNLELLSLVNKITQELNNHTGYNDKTLAEFIISLHDDSKTLPEFKSKLDECGASFPGPFVENIDRLILSLHPKHKKKAVPTKAKGAAKDVVVDDEDKQRRLFPGLAIKDQEWQPSASKDVLMKEVDDMMAELEGSAKRQPPRVTQDRSPKRRRTDRSRSPRRRSASPPRGRGYDDRGRQREQRGRPQVDEKPVLYKIYPGRVQSLKDFGAFVLLEGVSGRREGRFTQPFYPRSLPIHSQDSFMFQISKQELVPTPPPTSSLATKPSR
jgi:ATP-dependent RNA helicase DHX8/PRP22